MAEPRNANLIEGRCLQADGPLADSYALCRRITRSRAKNFYFGIHALPPDKRNALCAVYAFMRYCDDLSDDEGITDRKAALERWRAAVDRTEADQASLAAGVGSEQLLPAFRDAVRRYRIPLKYIHELIDGAEMDLSVKTYETFDQLYQYCYRVASTVGLTCIQVFGYSDERARRLAEWNGIAFQLTNILRDLREDAERGRVYLPRAELQECGYADEWDFVREGLARGTRDSRFVKVMRFQVRRARDYYDRAQPLLGLVEADSRPALWAMTTIYRALLERIESGGYDVARRRVRVPTVQKIWVMTRAWLRWGVPPAGAPEAQPGSRT